MICVKSSLGFYDSVYKCYNSAEMGKQNVHYQNNNVGY